MLPATFPNRTLMNAHVVGGRDGLIGRNIDESRRSELPGGHCDVPSTQHVVANSLVRMTLQEVNVLVGGGVENDLRTFSLEDIANPVTACHVKKQSVYADFGKTFAKLEVDIKETVL